MQRCFPTAWKTLNTVNLSVIQSKHTNNKNRWTTAKTREKTSLTVNNQSVFMLLFLSTLQHRYVALQHTQNKT